MKVAVRTRAEDQTTPVHIYMTSEQAWLTIDEAKALEKDLKKAIKDAKRALRRRTA